MTSSRVKILLFNRKLDHLSDEEFHNYWKNVHAALVKKTPILTNTIKRYVQLHSSPENRAECATIDGIDALQYDGCAEIWVESLAAWKAVLSDPEFQKVILPDELNFGKPPLGMLVGYENTMIGKPQEF